MEEKQDVFFSKCVLGTDDQEDEKCQRSGNFHFVSFVFLSSWDRLLICCPIAKCDGKL